MDDAVKVKGVLFSPRAIEHHLKAFPQLSGEFIVEVGPGTHPLLVAEASSPLETHQSRELTQAVALELKNGIGLTFQVKIVQPGGLPADRGEKRIHVIPDIGL